MSKEKENLPQLQSSPEMQSKLHNLSRDMVQFVADFASLNVKENASKSPSNKQRCNSEPEYSNVFFSIDETTQHQSFLIVQSVFNNILRILPSMIEEHLQQNSSLVTPNELPIKDIKADIKSIKKNQTELRNKLQGYDQQIKTIGEKIKKLPNENMLKNEVEKLIKENKNQINNTDHAANENRTIRDIEESQQYVSNKYDIFMREQTRLKRDVDEMKKSLEKQENKTEHMINYSRFDHAVFSGVPFQFGPDNIENCKEMIVNVCRELHYNIPINEISTAHRLKQHPNRAGPPDIIVRFKDRDIRNDVLKLKSLAKQKEYWVHYGIQRLYINEQLTPDKRKLMYQTKVFSREMFRIHGKIFVWSYKGEIYVRKAIEYAPKRKINCENDLNDIKRGTVSLDPDTRHVRNYTKQHVNSVPSVSNAPPVLSLHEYPLFSV